LKRPKSSLRNFVTVSLASKALKRSRMSWFETMPPFIFDCASSEYCRAAFSKESESLWIRLAMLSSRLSDSPNSSVV